MRRAARGGGSRSWQLAPGPEEEVAPAEVARLERQRERAPAERRGPGHAGSDLGPDPEALHAERADDRAGRLPARHDELPHATLDEAARDGRQRVLHQLSRPLAAQPLLDL